MNKQRTKSNITVKSLREASGLTQPQLGYRLNCNVKSISDWENGRKLPRFDRAVSLAIELGVSLKTLAAALGMDIDKLPDDIPSNKISDPETDR